MMELCEGLYQAGHQVQMITGWMKSPNDRAVSREQFEGYLLFRTANPLQSLQAISLTFRPDVALIFDGDIDGLSNKLLAMNVPSTIWAQEASGEFFQHSDFDQRLRVIAASPKVADQMRSLYGAHTTVIPPYINQGNYNAESTDNPTDNRILFVNPVRSKGIEYCLKMAQMRQQYIFTVLESWDLSNEWKKYCFNRSIHCGNLEWLPPAHSMSDIFKRCRLLLIPRVSNEGFARIVTEAQLCGLPAIGSDQGYLADNIGPGGTVISLSQPLEAWLEILDQYMEDNDFHHRQSAHALNHARRVELDSKLVLDQLLNELTLQIKNQAPRYWTS